jgi:hypothetical protein
MNLPTTDVTMVVGLPVTTVARTVEACHSGGLTAPHTANLEQLIDHRKEPT